MPNWIDRAVIYQIFVDRFAGFRSDADDTKPVYCGGNLRGIIGKLDYLTELGVTAIWLTPFVLSADYHGYSTLDFCEVDPHFGTLEDAKELVRQCHERKIKFILDFTANHLSKEHKFFKAAQDDLNSPYRQWFYFAKHNPQDYLTFLNFKTLPKINLNHLPARKYVIDAAKYWINELDIDGIRLDHAVGPSLEFWKEFSRECKAIKPSIVLLGEVAYFGVKPSDLKTFELKGARWLYWRARIFPRDPYTPAIKKYVGILDGCLDFGFRSIILSWVANKLNLSGVRRELERHYRSFPAGFILPSFLDNQDYSRFLYMVDHDYGRLKQALRLQFDSPQPKIIYYGSEVGMTHSVEAVANSGWAGDTPARAKMNWEPSPEQLELREFYKELIAKSRT